MKQDILETHEAAVVDIASAYLDNMELELGRKYKNNSYEVNAGLTDDQYSTLKAKHELSNEMFAELYSEFQKMKPTQHLKQAMDAFTASGGSVEMEPSYDENTQRLSVPIKFFIKEQTLDKIEGLSPIEDIVLKMNAMLQIDTVLSGADPDVSPSF